MKPYRVLLAAVCFQLLYHSFFFIFLVSLYRGMQVPWFSTAFVFALLVFFFLPALTLLALVKSKAVGRSLVLLVNSFLFLLFTFKLLTGINTTPAEKTLLPLRLLLVLVCLTIILIALQKKLTRKWVQQQRRRW